MGRSSLSRRLTEQSYDVGLRAFGGSYRKDDLKDRDVTWLARAIERSRLTLAEWKLQRDAVLAYKLMDSSATQQRILIKCDIHIEVQELRLKRLEATLMRRQQEPHQRRRKPTDQIGLS